MNWQPFLTKLNKIKNLAETAQQDGEISRLERDLLASYVRDLYEHLWDNDQAMPTSKAGGFQHQRIPAQPATPAPVIGEKIVATPAEPKPEPVRIPEPEPVRIPEPVQQVVEVPVEIKAVPPVENKPLEAVSLVETKPAYQAPAAKSTDPALLAELFIEEKVSDLSDKLASQKINDLTKAMGINEKIFTIQELFNNDNNLFNQTIGHLNSLPDFANAKTYISEELVPRLDWTSEKKIKKAATFIKLVRRRYM